jgi:hypothetical protein
MRRIIITCTTVAALVAAASAYAVVTNSYTATATFSPSKAGSAKSPSPIGLTLKYTANGNGGNRTAALTDINNTFYGLKSNGRLFPTCTVAQIAAAQGDAGCAAGSQVGTGGLTARIGPSNKPKDPGAPCAKSVHVYNAGQGKLAFILVGPGSACSGIGFLPPFPATIAQRGAQLFIDAPIPKFISHAVKGIDGSLLTENLNYSRLTKTSGGKKHGFFESVACKSGKRPYTTSFTADGITAKIPHSASC